MGFPSCPVIKTLLPMQKCGFDPWSGSKDPTCFMAKNPKHETETIL